MEPNTTEFVKAVIAASWQGGLVILLILLMRPVLGVWVPARWRYALWGLVLLRLLVPAFLLPPSPASLQNIAAIDRPFEEAALVLDGRAAGEPMPARLRRQGPDPDETLSVSVEGVVAGPHPRSWWRIAAVVWLAGAVAAGMLIAAATIRLHRRVRRDSTAAAESIERVWLRCCARLSVSRPPRLLATGCVESPALLGLLRPALLIPRGAQLSAEDWEHVFLHELAHFRRRDHWTQMLQLLALCAHWFNPLVWIGFRYLRADRELAADEWALRHLEDRRSVAYGQTLLKVLTAQSRHVLTPGLVGIMEDGAQMKQRLRHIVAFSPRRWIGSAAGVLVAVLLGAVVLGRQLDRALIRDRLGVALAKAGTDPQRPQFPFGALAPQLLLALQPQANAGPLPLDVTLDARVQFIAERALRAVPRGAAVVIDPRNGDILAAASVPSFDPNVFDATTRAALEADPTQPLANRVLRAVAPGAAFLPVTGLAGLRKGLIEETFTCAGGVQFGSLWMKCWIADKDGSHGALRLDEALKASCGAFFYQYGNAAGIEEIHATGKLLGLGAPSGLALIGEDSGILPNPEWLREVRPQEQWSAGYTANTAIGQGFTLATPLQLAMVAATIGNGGSAYAPRLFLKEPVRLRADLRKEGWTEKQIEIVRRGMWKTVNEEGGSGARARIPGVEVAGRTGTSQFWREQKQDNHAWFIGFAPYENPQFAVCVLVQGAKSGGGVAAPIAGRILAECLGDISKPRIEALKPAKGSFEPAETVGN